MAVAMLFLEIPLCTLCCAGPRTEKFQEIFAKPLLRAILYVGFAFLMWLSIAIAASTLIIPAIPLTATAGLYGTSVFKKEDPVADKKQRLPIDDPEQGRQPIYTINENTGLL